MRARFYVLLIITIFEMHARMSAEARNFFLSTPSIVEWNDEVPPKPLN